MNLIKRIRKLQKAKDRGIITPKVFKLEAFHAAHRTKPNIHPRKTLAAIASIKV